VKKVRGGVASSSWREFFIKKKKFPKQGPTRGRGKAGKPDRILPVPAGPKGETRNRQPCNLGGATKTDLLCERIKKPSSAVAVPDGGCLVTL